MGRWGGIAGGDFLPADIELRIALTHKAELSELEHLRGFILIEPLDVLLSGFNLARQISVFFFQRANLLLFFFERAHPLRTAQHNHRIRRQRGERCQSGDRA